MEYDERFDGDAREEGDDKGAHLRENFGYGLLLALRSQFESPLEALRELVDNAQDHTLGQDVEIHVAIHDGKLIVTNIGGRGMGPEELRDFVSWGSRRSRDNESIGMYGQGGKSAMCYLGTGYRLWCKRAGTCDWYRIEDSNMLDKVGPTDFGVLQPIAPEELPDGLASVEMCKGSVRVEILGLRKDLHLPPELVTLDISRTYARILDSGRIRVFVNHALVAPWSAPMDDVVPVARIDVASGGIRMRGWAGKIDRDSCNGVAPEPGLSLYWNGRRISEGVWFTQNKFAKGSLVSLFGELEIVGCTPNLKKSSFVEQGSSTWIAAGREVVKQCGPVLDMLRGPGDPTRINQYDRRLARLVRDELAAALAHILETETVVVYVDLPMRERGEPTGVTRVGAPGGKPHRCRDRREIVRSRMPEIVMDAWDGTSRAELRYRSGEPEVHVNKAHPAWSSSTARTYIAESAINEVLRCFSDEGTDVTAFLGMADAALAAWAEGSRGHSEDE